MSLPFSTRQFHSHTTLTDPAHFAGPSNTQEENEPASGVHPVIISQLPQEDVRGFSTSSSRLIPPDSPSSSDRSVGFRKHPPKQHEIIHVEAAPQQRLDIISPTFRRIQLDSSSTRSAFPPIQPRTSASIASKRPRSSRKLRNRDYYPSLPHQMQFDELQRQDPVVYQQREKEGLNSLDGDLDQTPQYVMPGIIECAILGSPYHRLTLSELRTTLKRRFRYYETEEERGAKSWERTLLQNLSKKERFVNIERPEPGQGGYWTLNHDAAPSSRTPKPISRRHRRRTASSNSSIRHLPPGSLEDTTRSPSSASPPSAVTLNRPTTRSSDLDVDLDLDPTSLGTHGHRDLGGSSSHFRYVPTQRWPDGRLMGRHKMTIQLPSVDPKPLREVVPTSPRHFSFTTTHAPTGHFANFMLQGPSVVTSPSSEPFPPTFPRLRGS